jgi:glyoxylate carboligase
MIPRCSNRTWGLAIVRGLQKLGVGRFFLSPGARGSALVAAVAEAGIDATIHYDERGMSFAALGWSMATGRPVVCITTSGSAVANLLPACVEAFHSGVPLIFVTADRPRFAAQARIKRSTNPESSEPSSELPLTCPVPEIPPKSRPFSKTWRPPRLAKIPAPST